MVGSYVTNGSRVSGRLTSSEMLLVLALPGKNCLLCHMWADEFANKRFVSYCDNASVVSIVNSKQSRILRVMDLVQHLTLLTLRHNFYPRERHIEGKKNDIADSLPLFQMNRLQPGPLCRPSPMSCAPSTLGDLNADIQS